MTAGDSGMSKGAGGSAMLKARGFTLIELMIVVVIVAILLTVALPSYQQSVIKSNRTVGRNILSDVAARQEQYFINNKLYADSMLKLGYAVDGGDKVYVNRQADKFNAADGSTIYIIDLWSTAPNSFSVRALKTGGQARDDHCGDFTLNSDGTRSNSGAGTFQECW